MSEGFTKADILSILSDLEHAIEKNKSAQENHGHSDIRDGKIKAYKYCKSRILGMCRWKGLKVYEF